MFSSRRRPDDKGESARLRALRVSPITRGVIIGVPVVILALLFPRASSVDYQYEVGSIWSADTLRAPFAFPLYKNEDSYLRDVEDAIDRVLPIFVPTGVRSQLMLDTISGMARDIVAREARPGYLSEGAWAYVQSLPEEAREPKIQAIAASVGSVVEPLFNAGVLGQSKTSISGDKIAIRRGEVYEDIVSLSSLYDSLGVIHIVEATLAKRLSTSEYTVALDMLQSVFQPTYTYSPALTEESREVARRSVPKSQGVVAEGEVIVAKGERITDRTKLKLSSYQRSRQLREVEEDPWWQIVGNLVHVSILVTLAMLYLYNFRRRIYTDNLQLGIVFCGILLIGVTAYLSLAFRSPLPLEFLIPMPLLSMLLVILFDSRTAFYLTVTTCFLVAGIRGADYSVAIACLSAGVLSVYAVRDIKSRTQLFRAIAYSIVGYAAAIVALGLGRGDIAGDMALNLGFAAINATVSPVLTFAFILLLENLFGIATDLKLLEYDNLNHPLLRALADRAPGTYQHTLTIARLAESAATAVGANALLAKVGSYFHDVGKIAKAEYFVENQMGMGNKHDKLKAEKSARVIRDHVLDGIELAQEYKLPQRVIDFIPMHHGTTVMQYFLDKARETNPEAEESGFRYPGPLPHSRETAIVMLADTVEATTRSLPNPTTKAIAETVDRMIKRRFSEGQLDQCELTLADLNKIKGAFVKNLVGMSHPRIQYKSGEPEKTEEKDGKEKQEPVIPYIDDAFGNIDADSDYGRSAPQKGKESPGSTTPERE